MTQRLSCELHKLSFGGVGAFGDGMRELNRSGLVTPIQDAARRGVWILGICLGMQFLVDSSEEFGDHKGLGLIL